MVMLYLVIDFLESLSPAESESEYALIFEFELNFYPKFIVNFK